jgi:hypothetical protein
MHQYQIALGSLPVHLILLSNGTVVFIRVANFNVIFDQKHDGVNAVFIDDHFTLSGTDYFYNTIYEYKQIPEMLAWLKQQNLQQPE